MQENGAEKEKNGQNQMYFFRTIFGRGDGQPPVKGGGAKEQAEKL